MKLLLLIILMAAMTSFAQDARLYDAFPRIQCGDFTARMDSLLMELDKDSKQQIFVLFYGQRYRKNVTIGKKGKALVLDFAHRDDGLNWAKAVPKYLIARAAQIGPDRAPNLAAIGDKVTLVNGGYREEIGIAIWLAAPGASAPAGKPTISERDITFRTDRPRGVPDMINCYAGF